MRKAGVKVGGRYEPTECWARHKIAIVVPYRNRAEHLTIFLRYMHPFLQRQQLNYTIIVVEQSNSNIGHKYEIRDCAIIIVIIRLILPFVILFFI
jgi:hypothetical protein